MGRYVNLHSHSMYSFIDGLSSTDQIAARAKELDQRSVAITDHGEVSGHLAFEKSCEQYGVTPIYGEEGYLSHNIAKQRADKDRQNSHIVLLAENNVGLSNLWAISTLAYQEENFYYKPLADWDMLAAYHEGIIATSACMLSYMARAILAEDFDQCRLLVSRYQQTFGEDNFFLEAHTFQIMDPQTEKDTQLNADMTKINQGIVQLSKELSVPMIVVNDSHFSWPEQAEDHSIVWMMSTNADQLENRPAANWHMSDDEIVYWMGQHGISRTDTESMIDNTAKIAERCQAEIPRKKYFPSVTPNGEHDLAIFTDQIQRGFKRKVVDAGLDVGKYSRRLLEEVDLIVEKEYHGYFNVVADYCKFAKSQVGDKKAWLVSASRGSAGASLAAYLMDITEVDPIKYDLMFSRFISPGRKEYPDIDLDFPQSHREELKDYLRYRYGNENICAVGTLSRLHAKSCLRDVGKAFGIPLTEINAMAKIISKVKKLEPSWEEIVQSVGTELRPWVDKYPRLFEKVRSLNGLIRQSGTHASGIIISDGSLLGNLPLRRKRGEVTTQFEYEEIAELGYLKFDALGLRHLDTMAGAWELVHGEDAKFDPRFFYQFTDEMYQDQEVWDQLAPGDTLGVFQIETNLGISTTKKMRPASERDVADLISVNRPGVIDAGMLDEYCQRRSGEKKISFTHPILESILAPSFGIVIFQEQVMEIAMRCAGYSQEGSDKFRKMMGKKLYEKMKAEKEVFIEGCLANPEFTSQCELTPRSVAENIWNQIEASGQYSFNKAHAYGYALLCCWGAYYKKHYYPQYITALLRTDLDPDKTPVYLADAKRHGLPVLPPSINLSGHGFTLAEDGLRFGLTNVKFLGGVATKEIIEHRPFVGFEDFMERVEKQKCNARTVENLIKLGSFDEFGARETFLRKFYESEGRLGESIPNFDDPAVVRGIELELLGMFVSSHPLDQYREKMLNAGCLTSQQSLDEMKLDQVASVGGQIARIKVITDKRKNKMAFLDIECDDATFNVTVFADKYANTKAMITQDAPVLCEVRKLKQGVVLDDIDRMDF